MPPISLLFKSLLCGAGEKVYLHCWGGRGRTGTVGACLLAVGWDVSAEEALERVQRAFDTRQVRFVSQS